MQHRGIITCLAALPRHRYHACCTAALWRESPAALAEFIAAVLCGSCATAALRHHHRPASPKHCTTPAELQHRGVTFQLHWLHCCSMPQLSKCSSAASSQTCITEALYHDCCTAALSPYSPAALAALLHHCTEAAQWQHCSIMDRPASPRQQPGLPAALQHCDLPCQLHWLHCCTTVPKLRNGSSAASSQTRITKALYHDCCTAAL